MEYEGGLPDGAAGEFWGMLLALGIGGCVLVGVLIAIGEAVDSAQSWKHRQTLKGLTDEEATAYRNELAKEAEAKLQAKLERRAAKRSRSS